MCLYAVVPHDAKLAVDNSMTKIVCQLKSPVSLGELT